MLLLPTCIYVFMLESRGGKCRPPAPLFLEKSPNDTCHSSTYSETSKHISFLFTLGVFRSAAFMLYFKEAVFVLPL